MRVEERKPTSVAFTLVVNGKQVRAVARGELQVHQVVCDVVWKTHLLAKRVLDITNDNLAKVF